MTKLIKKITAPVLSLIFLTALMYENTLRLFLYANTAYPIFLINVSF